jgi:hypothetical protein
MGLPAGQQRVLDAIEGSLRRTEPRLASMYAIFTRLTRGETTPLREQLPDHYGLRARLDRIRSAHARRRARGRQPRSRTPVSRRPLSRLLFAGQLMAILAVIGLLIGVGSSMTPTACASPSAAPATAARSHIAMLTCRGGIGK